MKFLYEYRTAANELKRGEVSAPDRDAAYALLRERGIRPARLTDAPGWANRLFGRGKRWMAIALLALALVAALAIVGVDRREARLRELVSPRAQLYGDPYVLQIAYQNLWRNHLPDWGDAFLALYAVPGHQMIGVPKEEYADIMSALERGRFTMLEISPTDLEEVARMKRMVNGMKGEFRQYVADGGTAREYAKDLVIRAKAELAICAEARKAVERGNPAEIEAINRKLRAMGLPLIAPVAAPASAGRTGAPARSE